MRDPLVPIGQSHRPGQSPHRPARIDVSVVIPILDEAPNLGNLYRELTDTLGALGDEYEIIAVDDGSRDGSWMVLCDLARKDHHLRLLRLARNFGQHPAICAGLECVRGERVIVMDADMQIPTRFIRSVLEQLGEGHNAVFAWRQVRGTRLWRRIASHAVSAMIRLATGVRIHDFGGGLHGICGSIARDIARHGEKRRCLPPLFVSLARSVTEVPVEEREANRPSRYNVRSRVHLFLHLAWNFWCPKVPRVGRLAAALGARRGPQEEVLFEVAQRFGFDSADDPGHRMP